MKWTSLPPPASPATVVRVVRGLRGDRCALIGRCLLHDLFAGSDAVVPVITTYRLPGESACAFWGTPFMQASTCDIDGLVGRCADHASPAVRRSFQRHPRNCRPTRHTPHYERG